jgi:Holliday junction resolvase RusA-like endonuclease
MGRNAQLDAYKQAIAEDLGDGHDMLTGKVKLEFYFWRHRAEYTTPQGRSHRKHEADLTNMQKATEDALQGILFVNDKDNNDVHSIVVEQGPDVVGRVVLSIEPNTEHPAIELQLPDEVWAAIERLNNPIHVVQPTDLSWPPKGAPF